MAKIMLVEDDNNLREIYEARLLAEGYEIVSAKDGEEALALAVKERPDLIISDVMMPKISGFDMLDILRSTPETKDTKVIMMTALSQAEDKARADKLGADRYLVKSQVTLEDVAKVAREVLQSESSPAAPSTSAPVADTTTGTTTPVPVSEPPAAAPDEPQAAAIPPAPQPSDDTQVPEPPAASAPTDTPIPVQTPPDVDETTQAAETAEKLTDAVNDLLTGDKQGEGSEESDGEGDNASARKRIIQPINDLSSKPDLNALLAKENGSEQTPPPANSVVTPSGPVVTPPAPNAPNETPDATKPGNVSQGGHDPNSIAL